jgi:hypothetical protein
MVTVLPAQVSPLERERAEWPAPALPSLARGYGDEEPECAVTTRVRQAFPHLLNVARPSLLDWASLCDTSDA